MLYIKQKVLEQDDGRGSNSGKVCPRYTFQGALKLGCALRSPGEVDKMHILIKRSAVKPGIGNASELSGDAMLQVHGPHRSKGLEGPNWGGAGGGLVEGGRGWGDLEERTEGGKLLGESPSREKRMLEGRGGVAPAGGCAERGARRRGPAAARPRGLRAGAGAC